MSINENRIINCRPELSKALQTALNDAVKLYKEDILQAFYSLLSKSYFQNENAEAGCLLKNAAECLKMNNSNREIFKSEYRQKLNDLQCGLGEMSDAEAANIVFFSYERIIEQNRLDVLKPISDLTKYEKHLIDEFFNALKAPARNPKIKVPEGKLRCYYDEISGDAFIKDLQMLLGLMKTECDIIIKMFSKGE